MIFLREIMIMIMFLKMQPNSLGGHIDGSRRTKGFMESAKERYAKEALFFLSLQKDIYRITTDVLESMQSLFLSEDSRAIHKLSNYFMSSAEFLQ